MQKIIELLRAHEGVETHGYKCTSGKLTLGVGRNIDPAGGLGLSQDEIDYLLTNDIKRVTAELETAFPWFSVLDEVRQYALIDLCFNLGLTRLKLFRLALGAMENQDYDTAQKEFLDSNWAKQVGTRAITVTDMIRYGVFSPDQ